MTVEILTAGLQTTIQAEPRKGFRHWGIPWSGPADPLSHALANRLVGNDLNAPALEISYGQFSVQFIEPLSFALMGAPAPANLDNVPIAYGQSVQAQRGSILTLGAPAEGVRTYLAVQGGFEATAFMGSRSTYLPAALGGYHGRLLKNGDQLLIGRAPQSAPLIMNDELQLTMRHHWRLRLYPAMFETGEDHARSHLFAQTFKATARADRMGIQLEGPELALKTDALMDSVPVFPGTVQCPPDGKPFVLLCDAQTTGGYRRLGQIARVDLHKLGQIRPGNQVEFLEVSAENAQRALAAKDETLKSLGLTGFFDC